MQQFEIVTKDDFYAVKEQFSTVAVIAYSLDENDMLDKVGVLTEKNSMFKKGTYKSLFMCNVSSEDASMLLKAKQSLKEIGYQVDDTSMWNFIGEMYPSSKFVDPVYCYSVDVTHAEKTPGTESFSLVSLNEASKINDSILQACFFKLFISLYKQDLDDYGITKQKTEETLG